VLAEMNRTLERLAHQAQILPGGLELGTVADQALVEMREGYQADAAMVLVGEGELLRVVGAFGVPEPIPTALRRDDPWWGDVVAGSRGAREATDLPASFRSALKHERIWLVPLLRGPVEVGLLFMAGSGSNLRDHRRTARFLDDLAVETSLALDNSRLFALVRELSVDRERRRIARDLHDGVVQTLVHVGFELDLLAREAARTAPDETAGMASDALRLRSVIEGSVRDVRATISDLRTGRAAEGLVSALREHIRDLRVTEGPRMSLDASGYDHLSPETEHELFRVAQEAISNAVQHAAATTVRVGLRSTLDGTTLLLIEDNGQGMPNGYGARGSNRGVGMRSMQERAALLGARLQVDSTPGQGTRVTVEVPRGRS
jgi:signal transduction histidine kinase